MIESSAVSYGKATPYLPVRDLLKAYFQIDDRDDGREIREKLTGKLLTLDAALGSTLPGLPGAPGRAGRGLALARPRSRATPPAYPRGHQGSAAARSQVQPLLLVCENLHWIDTETQAVFDSLIDSLPTARLLLLVNYRPEYQHGWSSKTYYTQLRLDPLPAASAEEVLRAGRLHRGLSPLSTPDSILMCYRKRPCRCRLAGGQREGLCSVHYKMPHEVFGVSVEFRARVSRKRALNETRGNRPLTATHQNSVPAFYAIATQPPSWTFPNHTGIADRWLFGHDLPSVFARFLCGRHFGCPIICDKGLDNRTNIVLEKTPVSNCGNCTIKNSIS